MNIQPTPPPPKKWTVLVYSAADNDLKAYMVDDVDEMEGVGSDASTDLVVQLDQGGKQGARRLHLQPDPAKGLRSPVVGELGSTNMSDPATLADFVEWGIKTYPAERYMVVISDHGDGWKGAVQDDSHSDWMSLEKIRTGLATARERTGIRLDVLGFDACNMAAAEVAYQLRDEARYMIASEKTEAAEGWPYTPWLGKEALQALQKVLSAQMEGTPEEVCKAIIGAAAGAQGDIPTLSAVDLEGMGAVADAVKGLADAVKGTSTSSRTLRKIAGKTESFEGYRDLYDFCERLQKDAKVKDPALKEAAGVVMAAVGKAVIAEQHHEDHPGAHGLTLEIASRPGEDYDGLHLPEYTGWPAAQRKMHG